MTQRRFTADARGTHAPFDNALCTIATPIDGSTSRAISKISATNAPALQTRRVNVHQRDSRVLKRGGEQNVITQIERKDQTTRANEGDF